jgi:hypothetical protein
MPCSWMELFVSRMIDANDPEVSEYMYGSSQLEDDKTLNYRNYEKHDKLAPMTVALREIRCLQKTGERFIPRVGCLLSSHSILLCSLHCVALHSRPHLNGW